MARIFNYISLLYIDVINHSFLIFGACHYDLFVITLFGFRSFLGFMCCNFYPKSVLARGYRDCRHMFVRVPVWPCVRPCINPELVCDNLSPVQAIITKFGPDVKNAFVNALLFCLSHIMLFHATSHHWLNLVPPNSDKMCNIYGWEGDWPCPSR